MRLIVASQSNVWRIIRTYLLPYKFSRSLCDACHVVGNGFGTTHQTMNSMAEFINECKSDQPDVDVLCCTS